MPTSPDLAECARGIGQRLTTIFSVLEDNRDALTALWARATERRGDSPLVADLAALGDRWHSQLVTHEYLDGLGFIAAPHALGDADLHIEWWRRVTGEDVIRRYEFDVDPRSAKGYDYDRRPYFTGPQQGHRAVDGPFLDYLATHAYILTFGVPVVVDGTFVGVSGADIHMTAFEQLMMPVLRQAGPVAVLNRDRRVVLANVAAATSGERLRPGVGGSEGAEVPLGDDDIGWRLRRL